MLELAAAAFSAALRGPSALGVGCWPEAPLPREKPEPLLLLFLGITECGSEGVAGGQQCEGSTHADCPENASSVKVEATDSQLHAKTTHADDLPIMLVAPAACSSPRPSNVHLTAASAVAHTRNGECPGCGIPPAALQRLSQARYRLQATLSGDPSKAEKYPSPMGSSLRPAPDLSQRLACYSCGQHVCAHAALPS